jgi:foldase protein PrsA
MHSPLPIAVRARQSLLARRPLILLSACLLLLITALAACGSSEQKSSTSAGTPSDSQSATSTGPGAKDAAAVDSAELPSEAQVAAEPALAPSSSSAAGAGKVIASVAGQSITLGELQHLMGTMGTTKIEVPVPPDFSACVAHETKASAGKSPAQLKVACRSLYEQLRRTALNLLIHARWVTPEAKALGLSVSEAALNKEITVGLKQAARLGQTPAATGRTLADTKFWLRTGLLTSLLSERIKQKTPTVSPARVAAYYAQHKQDYALPERRDLHLLRTDSLSGARRALDELRAGKSFQSIVEESHIRQPSSASKGMVTGLGYTDFAERDLSNPIFKARLHVLLGPVRLDASNAPPVSYGYFLFEVLKVHPPFQKSLSEVKRGIVAELPKRMLAETLKREASAFKRSWRARSDCRAGFVVESCRQYAGPPPKEDLFTY